MGKSDKEATLLLRIKTLGEEAFDKLSENFKTIQEGAVAAFAAISGVVVKSLMDYRDHEHAVNSLTRAMINNGVYSTELKEDYLAQADALQALTQFDDDQIIAAQATVQQYIGQTKVTKELTKAVLDLAAGKQMDLASAAEAVGKSIGTETNMLARSGVVINETATQSEKLKQAIDGINKKFGGQAEAAAQGLGAFEQLKNVVGDLSKELGEKLAPAASLIIGWLKDMLTNSPVAQTAINGIVEVVKFLAKAGLEAAYIFDSLGTSIGANLARAAESASAAMKGKFSEALDIWKSGGAALEAEQTAMEQRYIEKMKALDESFLVNKQATHDKELEMVKQSNANKGAVASEQWAKDQSTLMERKLAEQQIEMGLIQVSEEQKTLAQLQAQVKRDELILKQAKTAKEKLAAQRKIYDDNEKVAEEMRHLQMIENRKSTLDKIATLSQANDQRLAAIGKAAAITQIAIETPVAIGRALAAFPPPFNFAAAAAVGAAMAVQAGKAAGIPLAEGGIVMPRAGGTPAIIGEAGQPEAVIPLDRAGEFGLGGGRGNVTINFSGPVLGDKQQAREFAVAIDKELLELRRNNESVAFDSRVI